MHNNKNNTETESEFLTKPCKEWNIINICWSKFPCVTLLYPFCTRVTFSAHEVLTNIYNTVRRETIIIILLYEYCNNYLIKIEVHRNTQGADIFHLFAG